MEKVIAMMDTAKVGILFICMGNICRSPTAEGMFRALVEQAGLAGVVEIDSAGTHGYHVGAMPDQRAQRAARDQGYRLDQLRARQVEQRDFERFDLLLAMDYDNLDELRAACPPGAEDKLHLLMEFAPHTGVDEVPDPYYGGREGFELVLKLLRGGCEGLLKHIREDVDLVS